VKRQFDEEGITVAPLSTQSISGEVTVAEEGVGSSGE
jgi:hypothetical protein